MVNKTPKIILWYEPAKRHLSKTLYERYITIKVFVMEKFKSKTVFTCQRFNVEVNVDSTLFTLFQRCVPTGLNTDY